MYLGFLRSLRGGFRGRTGLHELIVCNDELRDVISTGASTDQMRNACIKQGMTTLRDSVFSTIAGAPAYVSKASEHVVNIPEHGMVWSFKDRNAIQGDFRFEA